MTTFSALTTLTGKDQAEALGLALEELSPAPSGVGVFEVEDGSGLWEVGGYFETAPDDLGLTLLAAAFGAAPFAVSELPETDWVAHVRRELAPVEAGRFFIHGSHDTEAVPEGCQPLLIEAAMAFGTGHHGTTLGCLQAFDALLDAGLAPGRVIDVGCGTAILAMAAARVWPGAILASDSDPVAVEVAEANVSANALTGRVRCLEAVGFDHPEIANAAPFDLIFANILKGPLVALAPAMAANAAPGAHVILSGLLNPHAGEVRKAYRTAGFNPIDSRQIVDWTTLILRKN